MPRSWTLLDFNKEWAAERVAEDPEFFERLCDIQQPEFLWIGCSDARVPANQITGLQPGEVFVHRNIANVVPFADVNSTAVIQYAVSTLKVKSIVVCGHYGCGGIKAALGPHVEGPLELWVDHTRRVRDKYADELDALPDEDARWRRLCELNVMEQVANVARLDVVREAWGSGRTLLVHGWIYDLADGLLKDLGVTVSAAE